MSAKWLVLALLVPATAQAENVARVISPPEAIAMASGGLITRATFSA